MTYTEVNATCKDSNVTNGAVYFGVTDEQEAIKRFLEEFPAYQDVLDVWKLTAKVYHY